MVLAVGSLRIGGLVGMKPSWEWTIEDVYALIREGVQESLTLDYKASAALSRDERKKTELSKDVSALANSAGGTLLYGVVEQNHFPTRVDEGHDPTEISKEWLEQIINSKIQRRIDGIRINPIQLPETGRVIYAVHIPQSLRAPHMASDHVYYKRFNFHSVPMEEYEVRDVARRGESPDLVLFPQLQTNQNSCVLEYHPESEFSAPVHLPMTIVNHAPKPAEYAIVRVFVDKRLKVVSHAEYTLSTGPDVALEFHNVMHEVNVYHRTLGIPGTLPIWQGVNFSLTANPMTLSFPSQPGVYVMAWQINSPGMPMKQQTFLLHVSEYSTLTLLT